MEVKLRWRCVYDESERHHLQHYGIPTAHLYRPDRPNEAQPFVLEYFDGHDWKRVPIE